MGTNATKLCVVMGGVFLVAGVIVMFQGTVRSQNELAVLDEFERCKTVDYDKTDHYGEKFDDVFYKIAELAATKDREGCHQLGDEKRDLCLTQYDLLMSLADYPGKEISLCEDSVDIIEKRKCMAVISLDPKFCDFEGESTLNDDACSQVLDSDGEKMGDCTMDKDKAKSLCLNAFYMVRSLKEKDIRGCMNINDVFTQLNCLAMTSSDPKIHINKLYRENACYEKYAVELARIQKDPIMCERIPQKDGYNKILYATCIAQFQMSFDD